MHNIVAGTVTPEAPTCGQTCAQTGTSSSSVTRVFDCGSLASFCSCVRVPQLRLLRSSRASFPPFVNI